MANTRSRVSTGFSCTACGWRTAKWVGRCPECRAWGTVVENPSAPATGSAAKVAAVPPDRHARPIDQVPLDQVQRLPTGTGEFDRVLGGGLVPGAAVLITGEPGIGKSTLLTAVAARAAGAGARVLYVSAEESPGQVRLRAERTGAVHPSLYISSETDLGIVLGQIEELEPRLVVIDSVQAIASSDQAGFAGSPGQVREVAATLIRQAKERSTPMLMVGHVTKDGQIAGPRVLEHLVDVACHFDGERGTPLRFVRAVKNRFGPTDEVGCFEMTGDGIQEVPDPSGLFLSRALEQVPGTCVTIAMDGRRAIPVEVQALVVTSTGGQPRRVVTGIDGSRLAMLLAVLEQHAGVNTSASDVYVSTVGGVRLTEPAADLAVALAVASAARNVTIPADACVTGEVSLAGAIRPASGSSRRAAEAARLGFTRAIGPDVGRLSDAVASVLRP